MGRSPTTPLNRMAVISALRYTMYAYVHVRLSCPLEEMSSFFYFSVFLQNKSTFATPARYLYCPYSWSETPRSSSRQATVSNFDGWSLSCVLKRICRGVEMSSWKETLESVRLPLKTLSPAFNSLSRHITLLLGRGTLGTMLFQALNCAELEVGVLERNLRGKTL